MLHRDKFTEKLINVGSPEVVGVTVPSITCRNHDCKHKLVLFSETPAPTFFL